MPLISQFYVILIYIYKELGTHHKEPHIHVKYNEYEMSVSLSGQVLDGYIPIKQKKLLDAWIAIHEEELRAAWYSYKN